MKTARTSVTKRYPITAVIVIGPTNGYSASAAAREVLAEAIYITVGRHYEVSVRTDSRIWRHIVLPRRHGLGCHVQDIARYMLCWHRSLWYRGSRNRQIERDMLYRLNFQGYWRISEAGIAEYPGIYCVYDSSCGKVTDILYIGRTSRTIDVRMSEHLDDDGEILEWVRKTEGRSLYFSAAEVDADSDIERLEAAMVYKHKPSCNGTLKSHFSYPETEVITSGKNHKLNPHFTV